MKVVFLRGELNKRRCFSRRSHLIALSLPECSQCRAVDRHGVIDQFWHLELAAGVAHAGRRRRTEVNLMTMNQTKLSAFATIFPYRLRTRMTQSWNFSPVVHIALKK